MRLNRDFLRKIWPNLQRGCPDPRGLLKENISAREATDIIAKIKIDGVFKTTSSDRYLGTTKLLAETRFSSPPVIIDVGASDGSTSLNIMEVITFACYYVTDRHIEAYVCAAGNGTFFCDADFVPFMYANRFFVVYNDANSAAWPLSRFAKRLFAAFDKTKCNGARKILLMSPALLPRVGADVRLERYNIFDAWPFEKSDLVIAANILNRSYFSDGELTHALRNLRNAMKNSARLAVIENRPEEQSSIFRLEDGRFIVESEVGHGSDIKSLIVSLC